MQYQLADLFESVVDTVPAREALVCDPVRLTYADLEARCNQLAHHLREAGIKRGDKVGCHMPNQTPYVETMIACFKIGAVPVNVNYRYVEDELRYIYDNADLACVVFDAEFADLVKAVAPDIDTLRHLVVTGDADGVDLPDGAVAYEDALAAQPTTRDDLLEGRSPDDLYMLYTGGTTGMPKGVVWRHEDMFFAGMGGGNPVGEPVSSPEELAQRINKDFQIGMFAAPPLMHGAAFLGTFIGFFQGSKVALIRKYSGHGACELIEREKLNTISIVGDAMAIPIIEALQEKDHDLSSLGILSTAGAIMSQAVRDRLAEKLPNLYVLDSFGSSETGYNGSATPDSSTDSGLKFKVTERTNVIDPDTLTLVEPGSGQVGRVAQTGHIPLEYYKDEKKTADTFVEVDGKRWVLMGDAATIDEEGVIHFLGRGSVCINSGGEKIFPEEVEAALKAHPSIDDAIVAGIPDDRWGERVGAVIQLRPNAAGTPSLDDVHQHLEGRIARYKVPRALAVVDEVMRSPSGKPDYGWAKSLLADQEGAAV
jgi:3-oxocholest-4-en-26-oate---CoA ligase